MRALGRGSHAVLTADAGPAARYGRWLAVRRGAAMAVIGTRAAMFAPVRDLGLVVVWDDGDDLHDEPRAPYPQVRTVLALRSRLEGAALVVGGLTRTAEAAALVRSGWAEDVRPPGTPCARWLRRAWHRRRGGPRDPAGRARAAAHPRLAHRRPGARAAGRSSSRCPGRATCPGWPAPPAGHPPAARPAPARWPRPRPARRRPAGGAGSPRRAGRARCAAAPGCARPRSVPGVRPRSSVAPSPAPRCARPARGGVLARVGPEPALVVATPGAEPVAEGGYAAALLLDGWALLNRPDLRVDRGGAAPVDGRRPPWSGPAPRAAASSCWRTLPDRRSRRWSAGTR